MPFLFLDLARQAADLPTDVTLLIGVNGAQLIKLSDFGIDLDLFNDGGIARGDCLDFRVGERAAFPGPPPSAPRFLPSSPAG